MNDRNTRFVVRVVAEDDVPALLSLVRDLAGYERLEDSVTATEEDLRQGLLGERAIAEAVIAWSNDVPAGFAVWYETFSTFRGRKGMYLEDLFVAEAHRGSGLGKALLRHVARVAVERGCFRLEWEVLRWNEPAIGFYDRLGGRRSEEWDVYTLSGDALINLAGAEIRSGKTGDRERRGTA
ncbi:MAG: GNAT family N-acetyltransferase [Planctomycetota bacterium]|nr:GNAT family N-acetyltransferase [Planctomycetaceae bacterium]MDQ3331866.1 GNAT family N-acetyltransferase [Planctomycetota bacterium]